MIYTFFAFIIASSLFSQAINACENNELNLFGTCIKKDLFTDDEYSTLSSCVNKKNFNKNTIQQCNKAQKIWNNYREKSPHCTKIFSFDVYCPRKMYQTYRNIEHKMGLKIKYIEEASVKKEPRFNDLPLDLEIFNKYYQLVGTYPEDKNQAIVTRASSEEINECLHFAANKTICNQWIKRFEYVYAHYLNRKFDVIEDQDVPFWGEGTRYHTDTWSAIPRSIMYSKKKIKELKKKLLDLEK